MPCVNIGQEASYLVQACWAVRMAPSELQITRGFTVFG